jgi:hypothetical protein
MQRKLLGIINVDYDVTGQLLIRIGGRGTILTGNKNVRPITRKMPDLWFELCILIVE